MKKIIFLLFITANISYSQQYLSDIKKENLKGSIKTLQELYFETENIYEEIQDEDGYPDLKITGYKKGKPKGTDEYIGFKNFYNEEGVITKSYSYSHNELSGKKENILNKKNQKTEEVNNNFVNGEFIKSKKYYSHKYVYGKNEVIETTKKVSTGKLYSKSIYKYNENGRLESFITEYYETKQKINQGYIYDSNNFLLNIINLPDNKINRKPIYINNKKGDVVEAEAYKYYRGTLEKYKKKYSYKYDNYGNWIERITFTGEYPEIIAERKIEYY